MADNSNQPPDDVHCRTTAKSRALSQRNSRFIPGGVVSLNRKTEQEICFVRGRGAYVWDLDGNRYIDYHAGFAPYLLGHADPEVDDAVRRAIEAGWTLMGSGATIWEGRLAELLVHCVPTLEKVQLTVSGSEATFHAVRLARAFTGREHVVVMQGGYNGWHNDVACNVMNAPGQLGERASGGEYPFLPLSSGIPQAQSELTHVIEFNDLHAAETVLERHPVACLMTEPILQNIGVVKPKAGYLEGLRTLCDRHGAVLVFDEVKTGFRHALGGYQSLCGVTPDLSTFGKALANGYPIGAIGGRAEIMDLFAHPDLSRRVMISGTYNGHPHATAAAIATVEKLIREENTLYPALESLGQRMEAGLMAACASSTTPAVVSRQGSAFCLYFMEKQPSCWYDIAEAHDMERDRRYRASLIERGIYHFPLPTKQGSISYAHSEADIDAAIAAADEVLNGP